MRQPAARPPAGAGWHLSLAGRLNRMLRHRVLVGTGSLLATAGVVALTLYIQSQPVTLKAAAGPRGSEDVKLMHAFAAFLARERAPVRLTILRESGPADAAAAIEQNQADLAVVRRDLAMPKNGQVIAVQRRNVVVLIARPAETPPAASPAPKAKAKAKRPVPPAPKPIEKIEDLAGKTVAIVGRSAANVKLLHTILAQYGVAADKVNHIQFGVEDLGTQLRAAKFDALLAAGPIGSKVTVEAIAAMSRAGEQPKFLDIGSSEAIEQQNPVYESAEIASGAFGGSRPPEAVETIGFSHFIVARRTLDEKIAGEVTRWLFSAKQSLGAEFPAFSKIESPDTDKAATLAVHPGALAYLDGEQKTFLERYSEPLYWGLMLLSFFGSGAAWLMSYARSGAYPNDINDFETVLSAVARARLAASREELDLLRLEIDEILERMIRRIGSGEIEQNRASALTLAAEQVRHAIAERRSALRTAVTT